MKFAFEVEDIFPICLVDNTEIVFCTFYRTYFTKKLIRYVKYVSTKKELFSIFDNATQKIFSINIMLIRALICDNTKLLSNAHILKHDVNSLIEEFRMHYKLCLKVDLIMVLKNESL